MNPVHIRRVLGPLRQAGIVRSRPGAAGGWELVRDPASLHLDEVWGLLADDPVMASHGPNPDCPVGRQVKARLREIEGGIEAAVRSELHGCTICDLV